MIKLSLLEFMNVQPLDIWRQIPIGPIHFVVDLKMTPDTIFLKYCALASMIFKSTRCV